MKAEPNIVDAPPSVFRIGEAAQRAGTSCRTLRYYDQLGLLHPAERSAGGARLYTEDDVARMMRIRELQDLLGFNLGEIGAILLNEDQLAELKMEIRGGVTQVRHRQIVAEAIGINQRLRGLVQTKQYRLRRMMEELDRKARLYRSRATELDHQAGFATPPGGS